VSAAPDRLGAVVADVLKVSSRRAAMSTAMRAVARPAAAETIVSRILELAA
jgi:UDP-N-acetylglucosamine:LPS N-acetylglucosamine transferase